MSEAPLRYILITPARNEEAFLELTIRSVVAQTQRPVRWLIVSDGSTDRTDEIVRRHAAEHHWIELLQRAERETRDFAGKAHAFNEGYALVKHLPHDVVASLDADLTLEPGHFEFLLRKLDEHPRLGLTGTPFAEAGTTYDYRFSSLEHVSGACQVFRRECLEQIGGYTPCEGGGIDVIAVLTARMNGWQTRTFTEMTCQHHRPMGSASDRSPVVAAFKLGQRGYRLGFHPLWQVSRSAYQMSRKPYITAGAALCCGYFWAMARRTDRPLSPEQIAFQRRDQMLRLRSFVRRSGRRALPA
jgi:glycosyltransferase involved in cell wall biosynthesis